jgi:ribose 5-phosphate isomerase B
MRIAVAADERVGIADAVVEELRRRGHEPLVHGALVEGERDDWAAGRGRARPSPPTRWRGSGPRCAPTPSPPAARKWNDANVLALSLRATSEAELAEILDAWFAEGPSPEADDRANVGHLADIERG